MDDGFKTSSLIVDRAERQITIETVTGYIKTWVETSVELSLRRKIYVDVHHSFLLNGRKTNNKTTTLCVKDDNFSDKLRKHLVL